MTWNAKYFDGQRPLAFPVLVSVENNELRIEGAEVALRWPLSEVRRDRSYSSSVVLMLEGDSEDLPRRVELEDPRILDLIPTVSNRGDGPNLMAGWRSKQKQVWGWLALLLGLGFGYWYCVPFLSSILANRFSDRIENILQGQVFHFGTVVCDSRLKGEAPSVPLYKLVRRIYPLTEEEQKHPILVQVVDLPETNAFTFPGHQILVMGQLIRKAHTPEELAGVLAHEIEHIQRNHIARMVIQQSLMTGAFSLVSGNANGLISLDPTTLWRLGHLAFSREMEQEADEGALARLAKAEISAKGFEDFFARAEKDQHVKVPSLLSTHPSDTSRLRRIDEALRKEKPGRPVLSELEWEELQVQCGG